MEVTLGASQVRAASTPGKVSTWSSIRTWAPHSHPEAMWLPVESCTQTWTWPRTSVPIQGRSRVPWTLTLLSLLQTLNPTTQPEQSKFSKSDTWTPSGENYPGIIECDIIILVLLSQHWGPPRFQLHFTQSFWAVAFRTAFINMGWTGRAVHRNTCLWAAYNWSSRSIVSPAFQEFPTADEKHSLKRGQT